MIIDAYIHVYYQCDILDHPVSYIFHTAAAYSIIQQNRRDIQRQKTHSFKLLQQQLVFYSGALSFSTFRQREHNMDRGVHSLHITNISHIQSHTQAFVQSCSVDSHFFLLINQHIINKLYKMADQLRRKHNTLFSSSQSGLCCVAL